jgi:hypothetical protein
VLKSKIGILITLVSVGVMIYAWQSQHALSSEEKLYRRIKDIRHPQEKDFANIQAYLTKGDRPYLQNLKDYAPRARKFKLIGKRSGEGPKWERICVNSKEEERENCLILYASYNKNYPQALNKLLEHVSHSDYQGHILYRIGGWPNLEEGDLRLACVPYAFKVCFFKEAQRLGYKRVLWLDVSLTPLISLNEQFSWIEEKGYLAVGNVHAVGPFFNEEAARSLKTTLEESYSIPSVSAGILGLDLTQERPRKLLSLWHQAAKDPHAFFSARPEQNALSILLYQLEMRDWIGIDCLAERLEDIQTHSLYFLNRKFAHKEK